VCLTGLKPVRLFYLFYTEKHRLPESPPPFSQKPAAFSQKGRRPFWEKITQQILKAGGLFYSPVFVMIIEAIL
jgi:hypothetical protein